MKILRSCIAFGKQLISSSPERKELAELIADAPVTKVNLFSADKVSNGAVLSFEKAIPQTCDEVLLSPAAKKASSAVNIPLSAEQTLSEDVLHEYREIFPSQTLVNGNGYVDFETVTSSHIAGGESKIVSTLKDRVVGYQIITDKIDNNFSFIENGKRLYVDFRNGNINGDEELVKELNEFLNGAPLNIENIQAFLDQRDLKYILDNGIVSFSKTRKSIAKGKEIAAAENAYHNQRQKEYEKLWRAYPEKTFYRVVGKEELLKALNGEVITSKNSLARYNRQCVDITTDPYYHEIYYGEPKYRITFKVKDKDGGFHESFTKGIVEFKPETQHYQVPHYTKNDIADICSWDGNSWISLL